MSGWRSPRPSLPVLAGIAAVVALALGRADAIRERALVGLGRGMPAREAALARGFVLGRDEDLDAATVEDFRRAGLAHLTAVSGQNVLLLTLLATPLLGALGIPLRERLVWLLGLIAVYVPLAGAGPTIQRAAVMGAASLVATLVGRRSSRLYALALAALVTLAIDPGVSRDVGWQLSFAAVLGIFLIAAPLRRAIAAWLGRGRWRAALAEGAAVTIAASLATAPLLAFHFERVSTTSLLANLAAMPAVAPAMGLGMLSAALAQVPGVPLEPLNVVNAHLLAYVAQVAAWCAAPEWAELRVRLSPAGMGACYAGMLAGLALVRWGRRALAVLAAAAIVTALWAGGGPAPPPSGWLRVSVLDVGQGSATLLAPPRAPAVLIDTGPPDGGLLRRLREAGVEELGAVVLSHDEADHAGGLPALLARLPVGRLVYGARPAGESRVAIDRARVVAVPLAAGQGMRVGRLRLEALWPPREFLAGPDRSDPNRRSLVLRARWGQFSMLLPGDAEAEAVPLDPGPLSVLAVAHHGSDDAGLSGLLDRTRPRLATISVGSANSFGHPTPSTLATLADHRVPVLRTDRNGTLTIDVSPDGRRFRVVG